MSTLTAGYKCRPPPYGTNSSIVYVTLLYSLVAVPLLILAGCSTTEPAPSPIQPPATEPQATQTTPAPERPKKLPPESRAKRPGAIPTRALNVLAQCRFKDETGYNGNLRLTVQEAKVQAFEAAVNIPGRGTCRFDLKSFRQTRELPNVELTHLRDPCIVRVWEQEERVTVAFQQCRKLCSGTAWDHLWPILNDRRDGSCA